jgi:hypothetical protein
MTGDRLGILVRFGLGSVLGVFFAFWLALAWEAADRHFVVTAAVSLLVFGALGQLPGQKVRLWSERVAPCVTGLVGLLVVGIVFSCALDMSARRDRCSDCCEAAGYASIVYAPEHKGGPWRCTCVDRTTPGQLRSDEMVCLNLGRRRAPD